MVSEVEKVDLIIERLNREEPGAERIAIWQSIREELRLDELKREMEAVDAST